MPSPRISICIPTKDRPEHLSRAIESVMTNGFDDFEIVVSDDAVDPKVKRLLYDIDPSIEYIEGPASGIAENWHKAVSSARGEYIMKLDDDDTIEPGFLQATTEFLDQHADVSIVFTAHYSKNISGQKTAVVDEGFFRDRQVVEGLEYAKAILLNQAHPRNHKSAGVFRRSSAQQISFFSKVTVDVLFTVAMGSQGDMGYIPEPLFCYWSNPGTNEGMGWRPLAMTLDSLNELFELPGISSSEDWQGFRPDAMRRMRLVVPLMYIANTRATAGRKQAREIATKLKEFYPSIGAQPGLRLTTAALLAIPAPLIGPLTRAYSRSPFLKRLMNRFSSRRS